MADPQWSDESLYKKTLNKWNARKRDGGMNANGYEEYPRMLYKAQQNPLSGKYEVCLVRDVISLDKTVVLLSAEQFNTSCQLIVRNEQERERAHAEGWRDSQPEAMKYHESLQDDIARAAAERAYDDRNMSPKAKAEIKAAEESTAEHLAEIKQKRIDSLAKAREAKAAKKAATEPGV